MSNTKKGCKLFWDRKAYGCQWFILEPSFVKEFLVDIYCLLDPELIYDACKSGKDKDVTGDIIGMFPENIAAKNFQPQLSGKCYNK